MRRFLLSSALTAVLALSACAPSGPEPLSKDPMIISAAQVLITVPGSQKHNHLFDETYEIVTESWVRSFHASWRSEIFKDSGLAYSPERDCNRFSAKFAADAQWSYFGLRFHATSKAAALAIGEFCYLQDTGAYHALNVCIVLVDGILEPRFIEPQTPGGEDPFVVLSATEMASGFFKRF